MTLRLFPSLPDHTTKTVCSTEIKHAGLHDSQNKANKKDQKSNRPQLFDILPNSDQAKPGD